MPLAEQTLIEASRGRAVTKGSELQVPLAPEAGQRQQLRQAS